MERPVVVLSHKAVSTFRAPVLIFTIIYVLSLGLLLLPQALPNHALSNHALTASDLSAFASVRQYGVERPTLKVITLAFNVTEEHASVEHNCALLSSTRHTLEVHTDDVTRSYCRRCRCVKYAPVNCSCFKPTKRNCALCEKLDFVLRMIRTHRSFVFMDSDVVLLRPDYMELLSARTVDFDFLAMYDDWGGPCEARYTTSINSGLMFLRKVDGLDYEDIRRLMFQRRTNDDQGVISAFVMQHYARWDTLSLKWHCRSIWKRGKDIKPAECFAFHGRGARLQWFLRTINRTLLRTG